MTQSILSFWHLLFSTFCPSRNSFLLRIGSLMTFSMSEVISSRRSDLKRCSVSFCLLRLSFAHLSRLAAIFFRIASVL